MEEQKIDVVFVHPAKLDGVWGTIEPWLKRAMEHGPPLYDTGDVLELCRKTEAVLWLAIHDNREIVGFAISSLEAYPKTTLAVVRWAGSEAQMGRFWLKPMIETLKAWGKAFGASKLTGGGRRGWLRGFGFREHGVLFEMDID